MPLSHRKKLLVGEKVYMLLDHHALQNTRKDINPEKTNEIHILKNKRKYTVIRKDYFIEHPLDLIILTQK